MLLLRQGKEANLIVHQHDTAGVNKIKKRIYNKCIYLCTYVYEVNAVVVLYILLNAYTSVYASCIHR